MKQRCRSNSISEYNTFVNMNMKKPDFEKRTSKVLAVLGNPFRIKILMAIGRGEACVCHLEAALNKRQAYISQHLMAMRDAGLLKTRRDGKYIFYRIASHEVFDLILQAAELAGLQPDEIPPVEEQVVVKKCICPHCEDERIVDGSSSEKTR